MSVVALRQLSMEKEEAERRELRRMLMGEPLDKDKDKKKGAARDDTLNLVREREERERGGSEREKREREEGRERNWKGERAQEREREK